MAAEVAAPLARYAPFRSGRRSGYFCRNCCRRSDARHRHQRICRSADSNEQGTSGEMSVDTKDGPIAAQSWYILNSYVATAGGTLSDVVKLTQYFRDLRDFPAYNRIRTQFFAEPPASTVVRVLELLPTPDSLLGGRCDRVHPGKKALRRHQ